MRFFAKNNCPVWRNAPPLCIDRGRRKSKAALIVGVIINIGLIGVFKYANLIMETPRSEPAHSTALPQE